MTPETERLHQLNAELTAQRDEARAERDKITSDYNLLAIELIDAHTSLAQAAAERDKAQADVERLVEGCVQEVWHRTHSEWFWKMGEERGWESSRADAILAVRRAAGLDRGEG